MIAREYLSQAFLLDRRIRAKERQLECMRTHAAYATPELTGMPKAGSRTVSHVEDAAVRMLELEQIIRDQIAELVRLRKEIAGVIQAVNNPECEALLEMRYLSLMSWEQIADALGYHSKYVFDVHRRALEMIRFT
jgi:hypothetical protein